MRFDESPTLDDGPQTDESGSGVVLVSRWRRKPSTPPQKDRAPSPRETALAKPLAAATLPQQICSRSAFRDKFFSMFAESRLPASNALGDRSDWITQVISLPDLTPALEDTLLAVCTARLGRRSHPTLIHESLRLYTKGLSEMRRDLARNLSAGWSEQSLATCLALLMYEVVECPGGTPDGYLSHFNATMHILHTRGASAHTSGLGHSVFQILRIHIMFQGIVQSKKTFLALPEWRDIPWSAAPGSKTPFDTLLDILLDIPELSAQRERLQHIRNPHLFLATAVGTIRQGYMIENALDEWFVRFKATVPGALYHPELSKIDSLADNPDSGKLFPVAFRFPSFVIGQNVLYSWVAKLTLHAHLCFTYEILERSLGILDALGRSNFSCTCDAGAEPLCLRHFTMHLLPPLGHRSQWPRETAYNICQSVEYFMENPVRALSPASVLPALAVVKGFWKHAPGNWSREILWTDSRLEIIRTSDTEIAVAFGKVQPQAVHQLVFGEALHLEPSKMLAMVHAARLKPGVRLQQELRDYESCLCAEERRTFVDLRREGLPDTTAITRLTAEIDFSAGKQHRHWRSKGQRLTNILVAVQRLAPIGDVLIGGSQNLVASGVWAAFRVCLEVSTGFITFFDKVSALLLEIGRSAPVHSELSLLFPKSDVLQSLSCEYLICIIQLCRKAILYTRKSLFSQFTASALSNFDAEFGDLRQKLAMFGAIIEKQVNAEFVRGQLQEASQSGKSRALIQGLSEDAKKTLREERILRLFEALCRDRRTFESIRSWERSKGNVSWLYSKKEYQKWKAKTSSSCLFLKGKLGCGKTVLMANVVDDVVLSKQAKASSPPVAYFFSKAEIPESLQAKTIAGTLTRQIISHPSLAPRLGKYADSLTAASMESIDTLGMFKMLCYIIPQDHPPTFLIVDGLDDCPDKEVSVLIEFLSLLLTSRTCLLVLASRGDKPSTVLRQNTAGTSVVYYSLGFDNQSELVDYVVKEMEKRSERWSDDSISRALYTAIRNCLVTYSDGMYLWVALVIDEVLPIDEDTARPSDDEIRAILVNLPKTLAEAYDRALKRIRSTKYSLTLFQIVAGAVRPLSLRELEEALSVNAGDSNWDPGRVPRDMAKLVSSSSGNLLTINEHTLAVHFVHHTAATHIQSTPTVPQAIHFSSEEASATMMGICITYLNYGLFQTKMVKVESVFNVETSTIPQRVVDSAISTAALPSLFSQLLFKSRPGGAVAGPTINIGKIIDDARSSNQSEQYNLHAFLPYAKENWLYHSRAIAAEAGLVYRLWLSILRGDVSAAELPWQDLQKEGIEWAVEESHAALLLLFFSVADPLNLFNLDNMRRVSLQLTETRRATAAHIFLLVPDLVARFISLGIQRDRKHRDPGAVQGIRQAIHFASPGSLDVTLGDTDSSDFGMTPLAMLYQQDVDVFTTWYLRCGEMLEKGANPSQPSSEAQETPLLLAVRSNNLQAAILLATYKADPNKGSPTTTPLEDATILQDRRVSINILRHLLSAGASPFLPRWKSPVRSLVAPLADGGDGGDGSAVNKEDEDFAEWMLFHTPLDKAYESGSDSVAEARQVLGILQRRSRRTFASLIKLIQDYIDRADADSRAKAKLYPGPA
ncbi:hypothetical protein B0T24DRAFT_676581 [Lasiosphaeria ovina]|uniref:Nephrocystin 3-like N-terminal domain-containing protein n=1 Tax=Lasiosphaeria ovina TaxID=92902 RepID=A0AAE0N9E7_9PEZI|nr:hypothetical protein B0T24DRAFT_676581 [Lasiosphaeria ovina]